MRKYVVLWLPFVVGTSSLSWARFSDVSPNVSMSPSIWADGGCLSEPEICDGIDNDCDGLVDEPGMPPDGIDGTPNPQPTPAASIGDACGIDTGACSMGIYACIDGLFACIGNQDPKPEVCDGVDNDCDGKIDDQDPNAPSMCMNGTKCVRVGQVVTCASHCYPAGFPCPPGLACDSGYSPETGEYIDVFCVKDDCGDCGAKTILNADGTALCAPKDTPADVNCYLPPVCRCFGWLACRNPCAGVECPDGKVCTDYGINAGTCVVDACPDVPCAGCNKACYNGACVTNPCSPDVCPNQVCQPSADYSTFTCVDACADGGCGTGGAAGMGGGGKGGAPGESSSNASSGATTSGAGGSPTSHPGACDCATTSSRGTDGRAGWFLVAMIIYRLRNRRRIPKVRAIATSPNQEDVECSDSPATRHPHEPESPGSAFPPEL